MKILFELFPIALFFLAYQWGGIYWATGSAIIASLAQILLFKFTRKPIDPMVWISFVLVTTFGGLTLWSKNHPINGIEPTVFIRWKPTVLYWIMSFLLWILPLLKRGYPMEKIMSKQIQLPKPLWKIVNQAWAIFFLMMGAANLYVAFHYPEATWVRFKLFGLMGLMIIFVIGQGIFLSKHLPK
jgi:intracellular septation protein